MRKGARQISLALIIVGAAALLGTGCLPGGGGGGGGGPEEPEGAEQSENNDFFSPGGEEPGDTTLTLTPPSSLMLDGQSVNSGEFVVESATAYAFDGMNSGSQVVVTSPVVISATIGTGNHDLFDVPATTEAIDFSGYFKSIDPDLPRARFNVTVFGDFSQPVELIVFLPENTDEESNQVSGATTDESQNTDVFTDQDIPPEAYPEVAAASSGPGNINPDIFPLNVARTAVAFVTHGRVRASPPVATGPECSSDSDCGPNEVCSDQRCVGDGALRFTLTWDVDSDFDLHVLTPDGTEISFQNPRGDNFTLDRDNTSGGSGSVENVFFDTLVPGQYEYWVRNFGGSASGPFNVRVFVNQAEVDSLSETLPAESQAESSRRTITVP